MLDELFRLSQRFLKLNNQEYERYFIRETPFKERFSILLGGRGTGKTTILTQHLLKKAQGDVLNREILYLQADHFVTKKYSLYDVAEEFEQLGGKWIAFDEIHKYPDWSSELKSICDTFPKLNIIASGSSALEIHKGSHDLSRRAIVYYLHGLSFREFLELDLNLTLPQYPLPKILNSHEKITENILSLLENKNVKVMKKFHEYLRHGYYPYFNTIHKEGNYLITLEQNIHTTVETDLVAVYPSLTGVSIRKIKQLIQFITQTVPFSINWTNIGKTVGISDQRTLKTYFKYLEDAKIIRLVKNSGAKMRKLERPEKLYLNNTNQYYAISPTIQNKGSLRETFFVSMADPFYNITLAQDGDFLINDKYVVEVGGKNKNFKQIQNIKSAFLACDSIDRGSGKKIPLWLFGFLY